MREIKFRVFVKESKYEIARMEYDPSWNIDEGFSVVGWEGEILSSNYNSDIIPMQYTGLKDKNGKEIYEGDVVNGVMFNNSYTQGKVVWWTGGWWIEALAQLDGIVELFNNSSEIKVIGNIYENPELVK